MTARGKIFTVPAKEGATRNFDPRRRAAARKRLHGRPTAAGSLTSPIATGEDEIYIAPQDGMGNIELGKEPSTDPKDKEKEAAAAKERGKDHEQQITNGYKGFMFAPGLVARQQEAGVGRQRPTTCGMWISPTRSPSSRSAASFAEITNYTWSPDSKWIAYDKTEHEHLSARCISIHWSRSKSRRSPANWSTASCPFGIRRASTSTSFQTATTTRSSATFDFEFTNPKTTRVYLLTLRADLPSPFPALSDETEIKREPPTPAAADQQAAETKAGKPAGKPSAETQKKEEASATAAANEALKNFRIDLDGIQNREVALPVAPASITALDAAKGFIYYSTQPVQGLSGPLPGEDSVLSRLRPDGTQGQNRPQRNCPLAALIRRLQNRCIRLRADMTASYGSSTPSRTRAQRIGEGTLNLSGFARIDPPAEWRQMFNEVWRQERDYFFEASMNGVDWEAVRKKYEAFAHVAGRYDLTYILGEMVGDFPTLTPT